MLRSGEGRGTPQRSKGLNNKSIFISYRKIRLSKLPGDELSFGNLGRKNKRNKQLEMEYTNYEFETKRTFPIAKF